jgi:hypothetical protein
VNNVFTDADGASVGNQALRLNSAALVNVTTAGIAGTYLVINDGIPAFQSHRDLVVNLTGYTGPFPGLGDIDNRPVRKLKRQSVYGFEDVLISARLDVIIRARDSYC